MRTLSIGLLASVLIFAGMPAASAGETSVARAEAASAVHFERMAGYSAAQTQIANRIASGFAAAGYGPPQQIAAVSVAIRESTLNPKAHNRGCSCYGLFQMNRKGGLGKGHSVANLTDPDYNIALIIKETRRVPSFAAATTVDEAVRSFVRHVTRPADKSGVVRATLRTARKVEKAANPNDLAFAAD